MIIAFIIWSIVAILLAFIGISGLKSDKPVGFFTFVTPPVVKDIKRYNKAVAKLWVVSAIIFEIIGIPLYYLEQNSPLFIIVIFAVLIWLIALIAGYFKIESKFKK